MDGLIEGRMVHYVWITGEHLPAIVVRVCDRETGTVNLQAFAGSERQAEHMGGKNSLECGIPYSETHEPGTWHWIERA